MLAAIEKREAEEGPDSDPEEYWLTKKPYDGPPFDEIKQQGWATDEEEDKKIVIPEGPDSFTDEEPIEYKPEAPME